MTYSSYPPAPGRHHLGQTEGDQPRNGFDRPGAQRDPAVWWGSEPAVGQSAQESADPGTPATPAAPTTPFVPAAAHPGWPDPQPDWRQEPGPAWGEPRPSWPEQPQQQPQQQAPQQQQQPDTRGGWQPPYQGAAEFQQEYVSTPGWEPAAPPEQAPRRPEGEQISSAMRGQIVDRMIRINTSHALQAADRIGTRLAVGPHCLALFSIDNIPGRYQRLSTATRLILDGEDAENLPDLLRDLTARAREKVAEAQSQNRRWEPRTPLTGLVLRSEDFSESTPYIGLGVSTLDTPELPWRRAKQNVTGADGLHLRGQGLIYLNDGTAVHLVRRAQMASGQHEITASRRVDSQYPSRRDEHLIERAAQQGNVTWELMRQLHEVLMSA